MAKSNSQVSTLDDATVVGAAETDNAPQVIKGANADSELSGEKVTLTIHPTEGEGGADAVFLSINGYAYQIPRGAPVVVPKEVYQVLKECKTSHYTQGKDGLVERVTQRFPFTVEL